MRIIKKWWAIAIGALLLISVFQNCSPVSFVESQDQLASTKSITVDQKSCDLEKKKEGETWMSAAGQDRELVVCTVGVGNQFKVYNLSREYICTNGSASLTGKVERTPAGMEGLCNLDCGTHKNGDLWFLDVGTSSETLQCPTSTTATSTVRYQNSAEYKCVNSIASATGKTDKKKIDETACPALTFNDQDNQATLAFEDVPDKSDSDYNDFVTNIKVVETYSSQGELSKIVLEYAAKSVDASLNHKLVAIFDGTVRGRDGWVSNQNLFKSEAMFEGDANIKVDTYSKGQLVSSVDKVPKNQDLIVFADTKTAPSMGILTRITITGIDGKLNTLAKRKNVSVKRYRTLLYVPDSKGISSVARYDVDISEVNPSAFDDKGRPLALFVPINWKAPLNGVNIDKAYPDFQLHADYLKAATQNPALVESDKAKNWFNNVILKNVAPM